jgi:uncharacterized membrane protein
MKKWIIPALSTLVAFIISIATYDRLPEQMAIHFGPSETPDNWMGKSTASFLLPLFIVLVSFLVWLGVKLEKDENKRSRAEATIGTLMAIISASMLALHIFIIAYNLGYEFGAYNVTSIIVGIIFIFVGNILPRLPQGSMQWPKLSEPVRRKVSRFQGRTMMIVGIIFLLLLLLPHSVTIPLFFSLMILTVLSLIVSTIYYSLQGKRE